MEFQEFWVKLSGEIGHGKKFTTMDQKIGFEVRMNGRSAVRVTPSTKKDRDITMDEFQKIWDVMKDDTPDERHINKDGRYSSISLNASYIRAMIDSIVHDGAMQ